MANIKADLIKANNSLNVIGTEYWSGIKDNYSYSKKETWVNNVSTVTIPAGTYIRDVLSQGNVTLAAELLGYRYGVTGIVRHGRQLGRTLGFPTMNVEPEEKKILPRFGVYVCRINIDGKWYNGIGNVGVKPTVTEEHKRLVEVFVYDYEGDAYGKEITVEFCDFERPEIRFSSVNELKKQVAKDLRYGKDYFKASKEI